MHDVAIIDIQVLKYGAIDMHLDYKLAGMLIILYLSIVVYSEKVGTYRLYGNNLRKL